MQAIQLISCCQSSKNCPVVQVLRRFESEPRSGRDGRESGLLPERHSHCTSSDKGQMPEIVSVDLKRARYSTVTIVLNLVSSRNKNQSFQEHICRVGHVR